VHRWVGYQIGEGEEARAKCEGMSVQ
jgi:hypothetical protein